MRKIPNAYGRSIRRRRNKNLVTLVAVIELFVLI